MFDQCNELLEVFKTSFPFYMFIFVPLLIIISPVSPVYGSHEFSAYRMQHYDLQGTSHGSRASFVNVEARVLESKMYTRKCVIAHLTSLTIEKYRQMMKQAAAAVLVLLPSNMSSLTHTEKMVIAVLEHELTLEETNVPVYFTEETPEISQMYDKIKESSNSDQAETATEALISSVTANGYQLVVSNSQAQAMNNAQIASIGGKLSGYGVEEQLPTIAIVAHYDAFAIAPALSFGADSNGSGVSALLELARLFSRLYSSSRTHPRFVIS
ncbi:Nicalin-1 [Nymphon striatum]|nr:Nicalin-1 [Nymphon striatum]